ncbi:penicillin acylase family protein [Pseudomonas aeruginosa]|nr:penicillin acylase family protein [Pseudomonas aeruginosa]
MDTSSHFTLYRPALDPKDPRRYLVDGRSLPLEEKSVAIEVRGADGKLSRVEHKVYQSIYGPLVVWPGKLDWNRSEAYALRDANLENTRVLQQWYSINQASDVADLRRRVEALQGIPWVNTPGRGRAGQRPVHEPVGGALPEAGTDSRLRHSATGRRRPGRPSRGRTAAVPGVATRPRPRLASPRRRNCRCCCAGLRAELQRQRLADQPGEPAAGLLAPGQPGEAHRSAGALRLSRLQGKQPLEAKTLEEMVTANHVFSADQVLPDLLRRCRDNQGEKSPACSARPWRSGTVAPTSTAAAVSSTSSASCNASPNSTARGRNRSMRNVPWIRRKASPSTGRRWRPRCARRWQDAAAEVEKSGIPDGARWGDLQVSTRGQERIAIPGGDGHFGVYNAIQSVLQGDHLEVVGGTSYIQLVTFPEEGPKARQVAGFLPVQRSALAALPRPDRAVSASNGRPCRSATGRSTPTRNCNG